MFRQVLNEVLAGLSLLTYGGWVPPCDYGSARHKLQPAGNGKAFCAGAICGMPPCKASACGPRKASAGTAATRKPPSQRA
jgi:hypothetical protein